MTPHAAHIREFSGKCSLGCKSVSSLEVQTSGLQVLGGGRRVDVQCELKTAASSNNRILIITSSVGSEGFLYLFLAKRLDRRVRVAVGCRFKDYFNSRLNLNTHRQHNSVQPSE